MAAISSQACRHLIQFPLRFRLHTYLRFPRFTSSLPTNPETQSFPSKLEEHPVPNPEIQSQLSKEDIRYLKDVPSLISPVSYPAKSIPFPEGRTSDSPNEHDKPETSNPGPRVLRRAFKIEEDKPIPFPTLLKVKKASEQRVIYDLPQAIRQLKANAKANFEETVEAHVRLGLNMRRTDMTVHGVVSLPHSIGKVVRVAVFAEGDAAVEARAAGADVVGGLELVEEIKKSKKCLRNIDKYITTELFMQHLKKISPVLKSLMPNPRKGSVTNDVAAAVKEAKGGKIEFKLDKTAIVHVGLGKVSLSDESLRENIGAFVNALLLAKPAGLKKTSKYAGYVNSFNICSTMGPGFPVSIQSISLAADHYNKLHPR